MMSIDHQMRVAAEDRQVRMAAESVVNPSMIPPRNYGTYNFHPDGFHEVLMAGMRYNGRMSNVRRFFCLFVTFDFLFTVLMWLICIVISGTDVRTSFIQEIIHYNVKTSFFDVIVAAAVRFIFLIFFYAILHIDHWCIVALSTSATCAFLLSKLFLYDWTQTNQPVFQVLLILTSFVLVWSEIWFLDIKVIPQEAIVRDWYLGFNSPERAPLLSSTLVSPSTVPTENIGSFYTPIDSPENSDEETQTMSRKGEDSFLSDVMAKKLTEEQVDECLKFSSISDKKCYDLIMSDDWKLEKVTAEGDTISYMMLPKPDGKVFKISGTMDVAAKTLINYLYDNMETSTSWNKQVAESKIIHTIDENTDLLYQATAPLGNGAIGPRDFVILRHRGQYDSYYLSAGTSVSFNIIPNRKNFVRGENGVGCYAARDLASDGHAKCEFIWIINTHLKGWIPQKMTDMFMPLGLAEFMESLRSHSRSIKG